MSENEKRPPTEIAFITGLSGSGKSSVAKCFEDLGYYCVDNLPSSLLRSLLEDPARHLGEIARVAIVTDVRAPEAAAQLPELLARIDPADAHLTVLFLEASDETLMRRFSETRRSHPLGAHQALIDAVREERTILANLRGIADVVLDTSGWSIHEIRRHVQERFGEPSTIRPPLLVWLTSFGFKHGIPWGTDLLFDVRFLNNPHFEKDLRPLTGRDLPVVKFLEDEDDFGELLERLKGLLLFLLPRYREEPRSYLSVGIGCTGGRHRSVAVTEKLSRELAESGWATRIHHRDIDKQPPGEEPS